MINLPHCLPVDTISLSSVMTIDHTQNEDDLYPKSPCHHTAPETVLLFRDQLNEDIGNVIVISIPMEETLCHNH